MYGINKCETSKITDLTDFQLTHLYRKKKIVFTLCSKRKQQQNNNNLSFLIIGNKRRQKCNSIINYCLFKIIWDFVFIILTLPSTRKEKNHTKCT